MQDSTANYCEPHERVCAAKSAPQRVATHTNVAFYFLPARGIPDLVISSTLAFVNLGRYVTHSKRCSEGSRTILPLT